MDKQHSQFKALARISQDFDIVVIEKLIAENEASQRRYALGGLRLREQGRTEITEDFSSLEELDSQVEKNMAKLLHRFIFDDLEHEQTVLNIA